MATTMINGIDVYHEVHGVDDGTWVLNIGGTGGDLRRTFPQINPMNEHFRVLSYDQRGLGQTSKPDVDYTMGDYADDAAALIECVIGAPCHVVGTSFGGMVALNLALRHPEVINRLALLCTSPGGEHASYRLTDIDDMDADAAFATRMRLLDRRWDPSADVPIPGLEKIYDYIVAQQRATPEPDEAAGLARQLDARDGHDVVDRLESIEHEALVCAGVHDGLAPLANSEFLVEHMPNASLAVFDGGHLFTFQDRSAWPTVMDFLDA